jgi:hypothetical protein
MYDEFASFLNTQLRERKETPHRVAQATGIPEHVLEQLLAGDTNKLPAAPYMHGYLVKLGDALDFDGEEWWKRLKRAAPAPSSGIGDQMPRNRFSRNRIPSWALWGVPLVLALLTFLAFRFADIIGLPDVAISVPERDGVVLSESPATLAGSATPGSRVTINGEAVPLTDDGTWRKEVTLQPGTPNDFVVEATKFLGRSRTASRRIFFEPPIVTTSTTSTDPNATSSTSTFMGPGEQPTTTIISF